MNVEIANRLAELRKQKGFSQEDLANELGVSRQAVSKWETASASPDTDNLIALSKLYGVSLDELVGNPVIKEDNPKEGIVVSDKEITITDDEGQTITIKGTGDNKKKRYTKKQLITLDIVNGVTYLIALAVYLVLGFEYKLWHPWWMVFLLPEVVVSLLRAIFAKKASKFNFGSLMVFIYFLVSFVILDNFELTWIILLPIFLYYLIVNNIEKDHKSK